MLPALPIIDKGEHGGRKLDMGGLKPGQYYRAADGEVLLYDGEALLPVAVETQSPTPPTPTPRPCRCRSARRIRRVRWRSKGIA